MSRARAKAPVQPAMTVVMGYLEGASQKDAAAYARGYIERRFEARAASWWSVARFGSGFLWEAHEGGDGQSYLPSVIAILSEDESARVWVPSGERTFEIVVRDGKPLGLMLPNEAGDEARQIGIAAEASGGMRPFESKGRVVFALGCAVFALGLATLLASAVHHAMVASPVLAVRPLAPEQMPHRQWDMALSSRSESTFVKKLEFSGGRWTVTTENATPSVPAAAPVPPPSAPPVPPAAPPVNQGASQ